MKQAGLITGAALAAFFLAGGSAGAVRAVDPGFVVSADAASSLSYGLYEDSPTFVEGMFNSITTDPFLPGGTVTGTPYGYNGDPVYWSLIFDDQTSTATDAGGVLTQTLTAIGAYQVVDANPLYNHAPVLLSATITAGTLSGVLGGSTATLTFALANLTTDLLPDITPSPSTLTVTGALVDPTTHAPTTLSEGCFATAFSNVLSPVSSGLCTPAGAAALPLFVTPFNLDLSLEVPATAFGGVAAVPEPTTWVMMGLGLGALGLAVRRRRPVATLGRPSFRPG